MLTTCWYLLFVAVTFDNNKTAGLVRLAVMKDDGVKLLASSNHFERWMATAMENVGHSAACPYAAPIQLTTLQLPSIAEFDDQQHLMTTGMLKWAENTNLSSFDGFVLVTADCQTADIVVASLFPITNANLVRMDLMVCPSQASPRPHQHQRPTTDDDGVILAGTERLLLPLHRLNEMSRDSCAACVLYKWLEQQLCLSSIDDDTKRLLQMDNGRAITFSNFDVELQSCCLLDSLTSTWTAQSHPKVGGNILGSDATKMMVMDAVDATEYFNGKTLRLTSLERPPFVIFKRHPNGTVFGYSGFCYEIIHALQEIYNFTYQVHLPLIDDRTYGKHLSNGSWGGMLGLVVNEMVDIGVSPFSVTHSRSEAVDFSVPFYEDPAAILIPPPAEDNRLLACAKPFRWQVWLGLISFAAVLPAILWQSLRMLWSWKANGSNSTSSELNKRRPILARQCFFVLGVLVGQSGQKLPALGISPRLLGVVWCLSAVVFASAYVGILMSFLRFPKLSPIIFQLEDLPGSRLQWGVQKGTALEALFTEAPTGIYKTIGDALLQRPESLVNLNTDGIDRTTNGSYAFIKEKSFLEFAVEEDYVRSGVCRLSIARHEFFKVNFAFALPKNSRIKPILDKKIMQMTESGLAVHWKRHYWPQSGGRCGPNAKKPDGPKSLGLSDLQGAFFILAVGSISACMIFFAELAFGSAASSVTPSL